MEELVVGLASARQPDDGEAVGERAVDHQIVERGYELAFGEVAGEAEDDDGAGLGLGFLNERAPGDLLGRDDAVRRSGIHRHASVRWCWMRVAEAARSTNQITSPVSGWMSCAG